MKTTSNGPSGGGDKLCTTFGGLDFANPMIVPAGVHGRDDGIMVAVSASGVSGTCAKTIVSQPARDVLPCFSSVNIRDGEFGLWIG